MGTRRDCSLANDMRSGYCARSAQHQKERGGGLSQQSAGAACAARSTSERTVVEERPTPSELNLRDNDPVPGTSFPVRSALGRAFRLGLAAVLVGVIGVVHGASSPGTGRVRWPKTGAPSEPVNSGPSTRRMARGRSVIRAAGHGPPTIVGAVRLEVVSTIRETSTHHRGAVIARWQRGARRA